MVLVLFAISIFLGAALLFVVQPMVARMILPELGGSPAVWNTAMVFFQATLLAGYLYAHLLTRRFGARGQVIVHSIVLLVPAIALPIALPGWTPPATSFPVGWMLLVLLVAVGLPFFVVSTTGPLMQRWFSRTEHASAKDPYFLYAASNTGSLLALLGYPLIIEPVLGLRMQSGAWTVGYGLFVVCAITCGVTMLRRPAPLDPDAPPDADDVDDTRPITWRRRLLWVLLAFVPSSLMLGVTQHVSTDIAAAPLLWVIPLSIYLLTFIMAFSQRWRVPQASAGKLYPIIACAVAIALLLHARSPGMLIIAMHMLLLLIGALLCHTRLADDRPAATRLTEFYLLIALGGVLGGAFNALIAPVIFSQLYEYPIVIVLAAFLIPSRAASAARPWLQRTLDVAIPIGLLIFMVGLGELVIVSAGEGDRTLTLAVDLIRYGLPVLACFLVSKRPVRFALVLGVLLMYSYMNAGPDVRVLRRDRTFFGAYRVIENTPPDYPASYELTHGTTSHGSQMIEPPLLYEPTGYYARSGPVGDAMDMIQAGAGPQRAGLVGLGVGTLAAYARDADTFVYYEIDPVIIDIAEDRRFFSYLRNAENKGAIVEFVVGDARLTMGDAPPGGFDYLVLDAFTSDAIPIHLLTTEAIELFMSKVADDGVVLMHVSNQHLNLEPVVSAIVDSLGLKAVIRWDMRGLIEGDPVRHAASTWVVIARRDAQLAPLIALPRDPDPDAGFWRPLEPTRLRPWTDDHANLLSAFDWD